MIICIRFFAWRSDQRGRELLVEKAVRIGDRVLACGAGTGSTGFLAAQKIGPGGRVVLLDMSSGMLEMAKGKDARSNLQEQFKIKVGDMLTLPFENNSFDDALSAYSLYPVYDRHSYDAEKRAALETWAAELGEVVSEKCVRISAVSVNH